jgi:hypothetical protein
VVFENQPVGTLGNNQSLEVINPPAQDASRMFPELEADATVLMPRPVKKTEERPSRIQSIIMSRIDDGPKANPIIKATEIAQGSAFSLSKKTTKQDSADEKR